MTIRVATLWCTGCCALLLAGMAVFMGISLFVLAGAASDIAMADCACEGTEWTATDDCIMDVEVFPINGTATKHEGRLDVGPLNYTQMLEVGMMDPKSCAKGCATTVQNFTCWYSDRIPNEVFLDSNRMHSAFKSAVMGVLVMLLLDLGLMLGCCGGYWKLGGPWGCRQTDQDRWDLEDAEGAPLLSHSIEPLPPPPLRRQVSVSELADTFKDDSPCVVCLDKPRSVAFMPCRHYCACVDCSKQLVKCPLCRSTITEQCFTITSARRRATSGSMAGSYPVGSSIGSMAVMGSHGSPRGVDFTPRSESDSSDSSTSSEEEGGTISTAPPLPEPHARRAVQ